MEYINKNIAASDLIKNPKIMDNEKRHTRILVGLPTIEDVSVIHIIVGKTKDASDLVSYNFKFDQTNNLPADYFYHRDGNTVVLGMGEFTYKDHYFARVIIEYADGTKSDAKYFTTKG